MRFSSLLFLAALVPPTAACSSSSPGADDASDASSEDTSSLVDHPPLDYYVPDMGMSTCPTPNAIPNFMPPAYVPPNPPQFKCDQTQIQGYWDNCRASGNPAQCQQWGGANMACAKCIDSMRTDASWGPIVKGGGVVVLNLAGCIDIKGDKPCAQAYENSIFCQQAACDSVCPITDAGSLMLWNQCAQAATSGVCKLYDEAFKTKCIGDAGSAYDVCHSAIMNFMDGTFAYATLFCSSGG